MESIHPTTIDGTKRIARERDIPHADALDAAALQAGYRNLRHAQNVLGMQCSTVADSPEAVEAAIEQLMELTRQDSGDFVALRRSIARLILRAVPLLQVRNTYWAKINLVQAVRDLDHNMASTRAGNSSGLWLYPALLSLKLSLAAKGTYNETYTPPEPAIKDMSFDALSVLVRRELLQYV